ncbi:hypothetical protein J3E07_001568 [Methanococcus voltae]|uniref:Transglutaminase-like domain-containing protein n=1 Tax=Methanococcus voltae TaxID=2188 RepID=A0A8J7RFA1_METVO|nr:transglutaminase domain-containing protein [Methanococcus voltae]MBP2202127.1 hypothetical protein [Methanococcus voltae]
MALKLNKYQRFVLIVYLSFLTILSFLVISYHGYEYLYEDEIVENAFLEIGESDNPHTTSQNIILWEWRTFISPYSYAKINGSNGKFGLYNINEKYYFYTKGLSVPWIITFKTANCGEYSNIYVYLMNKKGIDARCVGAPGEDHQWAEYYVNGTKYIVDPSAMLFNISDTERFAEDKNWSYVWSYYPDNVSSINDVSDEYINRGAVNITILENGKPIKALVWIKSPYLMKVMPNHYNTPKLIMYNLTDGNGNINYKLGEKEYIIDIIKVNYDLGNNHYLFDTNTYTSKFNVSLNESKEINVDITEEKGELKLINMGYSFYEVK